MLELLQLLGPLLDDVLDLRLCDHQNFLTEKHQTSVRQTRVSHVWTHLFLRAFFFCRGDVVSAMFSDRAQHTDAHLVGATEQLQALLVLGADLPVQVSRLVHQLVPLEGGRLIMRLDVRLAVVRQAHEARLDGLVPTADAEVTEGFPVQVGERGELGQLTPALLVHVGQVPSQHGAGCAGGPALGAAVHTQVVKLVPVDLDAFQAVDVATGNGDRVSERVGTQGTKGLGGQRETRLGHRDKPRDSKKKKKKKQHWQGFSERKRRCRPCLFKGEVLFLL